MSCISPLSILIYLTKFLHKSWLENLLKVRNKFTKNKSGKMKEKFEVQETKVTNYGQERIGNDVRVRIKDKER